MTDDTVVPFPNKGPGWNDADMQALEADLTAALGLPVTVVSGTGDHVITIRANGLEGLDRFCNIVMTGAATLADR